jgi:hypothetical protein
MMLKQQLEADYLIIGAGAMGMAFADELQLQDPQCSIIIVDRHASPGGHWNDAYPFVTLHQPALFYGVNSETLGTGGGDLSSRAEILAYYERVLAKMLRSGRVQYFPQSESMGGSRFRSLLEPDLEYEVRVQRKIVDATYMNVEVPSVRGPQYDVAEGADLVPINGLADLRQPVGAVVVIGAGKTGIDAVLYLLGRGVAPERIHWVIPNDSWFLDRAHIQPNQPADKGLGGQLEVLLASDSMEEAMTELARREQLLRLDPEVWPTKYRCATVSRSELDELRRVRQVIRKGRVVRVEAARMTLEQGEWSSSEKVLFVDCTADGLARRDRCPVFEGPRITLQSLVMCQQVFSAAVTAMVEIRCGTDESEKNRLCQPVPHPVDTRDFLVAMAVTSANLQAWGQSFGRWLRRSRLSMISHQSFPNLVRQAWQSYRSFRSNPEPFENLLAQEFPESRAPEPPEASRRD